MKAYPNYKDSGVPWLGEVPAHWVFKRSKSVFRTLDIRSEEGKEELLSVSEKNGVALRKKTNVTMFQAASYVGYKLCWPNDLVINSLWAWMTGLGFSKYHGIISTAYSVFTIWNQGKFDSHYGNYLLRSKAYNWEFRVRSKGIWRSRYQLSDDSFLSMPLLIPPLHEQQQIARYLDWQTTKVNRFIKAGKKLIALLKEQKQNILNEAVTKGLHPDVPMKDSGVEWLGKMPAHWEALSIRRCSKFVKTGATPPSANEAHFTDLGFNWFTPSDFKEELFLNKSNRQLSEIGKEGVKIFPNNTVMMIGIGGTIGKVSISPKIASCNQQINAICTNERVIPRFMLYSLRCLREFIVQCGKYTTMPIINQDEIKSLKIPVPPVYEQQEIVTYIEKETALIDKTIARTERKIELIQEYHTRLISDVVTGKIDVRDLEIPDFEPVEEEVDIQNDAASEDELITEESEE